MDASLVEAVGLMAAGSEEGFNRVYQATYKHAYFRAKSYMNNEEDTFDLLQNVYMEVYKNINTLKNPEALFGWLDAIIYRQGMKLFRKKKEILLSEDADGVYDILENEEKAFRPEITVEEKATGEILRELIDELPELQKAAIIAYYYDGFSIKEIAKMQECSVGTVKSRLSYARKALKEKIEVKEKSEGYKLHVITLSSLWYAIKMLYDETGINADMAQSLYEKSCKAVGIATSTAITAATAIMAESVGNSVFAAEEAPSALAAVIERLSSLSMGVKAFIMAASVAIAGITGNVANMAVQNNTALGTENKSEVEVVNDIQIWPADYFEYGTVDGKYYVCTGFSDTGFEQYLHHDGSETVTVMLPMTSDTGEVIEGFYFLGGNELVAGELKSNFNIICPAGYICYGVEKESCYATILNTVTFGDTGQLGSGKVIENIENIIISDSVKGIGAGAFKDCKSLKNVVIADGVETIDTWAFYNCASLISVTIPGSVKNLGNGIFEGCYKIEEVVFGEGIVSIVDDMFRHCRNLKKAVIPKSVDDISATAFLNCENLTIYGVPGSEAEDYARFNGIAFEAYDEAKKEEIQTDSGIEEDVIKEITLEWTSEHFVYSAMLEEYYVCTGFSEKGWEEYDAYRDYDVITIVMPKSDSVGKALQGFYFEEAVDKDYTGGRINIVCPEGYAYYGIDDKADFYLEAVWEVTLGRAIHIGGIVGNFANIRRIIISENSYYIASHAFQDCDKLISIEIPDSVTVISAKAFSGCTSLKSIVIPESVTMINENAFEYCISLEKVELRKGLNELRQEAFKGCSSLTEITIPESVWLMDENIFEGCMSLRDVTILSNWAAEPDDTILGDMGSNITVHCRVGDVTERMVRRTEKNVTVVTDAPERVLPEAEVPGTIVWPAEYFTYEQYVDEDYEELDYVCTGFSKKGHEEYLKYKDADYITIRMPVEDAMGKNVKGFMLKDSGIEDISGMKCKLNLVCPNSYVFYAIDENDIYYMDMVNEVTLGVREQLLNGILGNFDNIKHIIIPDGVLNMFSKMFRGCDSLESIVVAGTVQRIEMGCFDGCTSLVNVEIQHGVNIIGDNAFKNCTSLVDITLPASICSVGTRAFENCTVLKRVVCFGDWRSAGKGLFEGCSDFKVICEDGSFIQSILEDTDTKSFELR